MNAIIAIGIMVAIIILLEKIQTMLKNRWDTKLKAIKAQTDLLKIIRKEEFFKLQDKLIDGKNAFEVYCSVLLEIMGYEEIEVTSLVADGGKDIVCRKNGKIHYVECKLWDWQIQNNSVGRPVVQKLAGAMLADNVDSGIIITSSYFTNEAKEYQKSLLKKNMQIELMDGDKLLEILEDKRANVIPKLVTELTPLLR